MPGWLGNALEGFRSGAGERQGMAGTTFRFFFFFFFMHWAEPWAAVRIPVSGDIPTGHLGFRSEENPCARQCFSFSIENHFCDLALGSPSCLREGYCLSVRLGLA